MQTVSTLSTSSTSSSTRLLRHPARFVTHPVLQGGKFTCPKKKLWNELGKTRVRANLRQLRLENLCAKRCITFARASMARTRRSRPLPSDYPRRGVQVWSCRRPGLEKPQPEREPRRNEMCVADNPRAGVNHQPGAPAQLPGPCAERAIQQLRVRAFPSRLVALRDSAVDHRVILQP